MEIEIQIGKRLRQARLMKKMSLEELSDSLGEDGISRQALCKYESGEVRQNEEVLKKLSVVLGVEMDFFYRPINFDIEATKVEFRKKKMSEKDVNALKMQIQDDIENYIEVDRLLNGGKKNSVRARLKPAGIVSKPSEAEEFAGMVRKEWQLGESGIANVYALLESAGIAIIETKGPESFDGVSGETDEAEMIIVMNQELSGGVERRRFTAMHELGHLLMQSHIDEELTPSKVEKLCHAFASEMLLPTSALRQEVEGKPSIGNQDLINIQCAFGISTDAIMLKLNALGIVSDSYYRTYQIKKKRSPKYARYMEQTRYMETKPDKMREMVYRAVMMELMTYDKAAQMLGEDEERVMSEVGDRIRLR